MVIVAAVDRSDPHEGVVEEANKLAVAFEKPLHVVHVLNRGSFLKLERASVEKEGESVPVDKVRSMAKEIAADATDGITPDAEAVGLVGDPADKVVEYADQNDASYIVVGGRKRSPVGKALFGSVTQSILLDTSRPVVTITDGSS
ncbi:universal stress protein [Halostagnicola kamekurae]|uniref:Nucleotide-binding universal stress protein, UspA family n=1 Tax=Halostagnicola kamekurae TaxID=619731 RepID=A0A1I6UP18_9EURY|nr:universal stress protein [Halostagnicola kamekurae]SFT03190.1 Nucleotide-binding universal stress protein, UspA family [Halostagnicola kamekurae]